MEFTELTVAEYTDFIWNTNEMSHYFQLQENIKNREADGYPVVLLGVKENGTVKAASLFSKIPTFGRFFYYSNRGPVMDITNSELVTFYFKSLDAYLKTHQALYVKLDPYWIYKTYDKDVNYKEENGTNDAIINQLTSLGYQHTGFTVGYSTETQVRWMSVLYLQGETPDSIMKQFDSQRKRNIKKAQKYGVKIRLLQKDELDAFLSLYRETEERAGFIARPDQYFEGFSNHYDDKVMIPLAYIDLDEYIDKLTQDLSESEARRDQMMSNENKSDKQMKKIEQLDREINHIQNELLEMSTLRKTDGKILNLASGMFFLNHFEVNYFSGGSSEKYNKFMGPYAMHWYMINYCLEHGYDRYNFYGVSGDFSESGEDYGVYRFKRGFNAQIEELVGDFIKPINKPKYRLYKAIQSTRLKLSEIKNKRMNKH
ncbi:aminoacyltransferase [Macrococcoides caseolyticum]|uniref:aminoacyltransferase n=1 Tax=Macrococcoides caseolyticum TaxID=69966 RepID=UPI001F1D212D|nr:aminoacyltransferase [Macrococcus caseolyticus]MCE4956984.1 aminoacyltransferase [Macrococcus caseolyticus]